MWKKQNPGAVGAATGARNSSSPKTRIKLTATAAQAPVASLSPLRGTGIRERIGRIVCRGKRAFEDSTGRSLGIFSTLMRAADAILLDGRAA
jgi:hypothetical protein